MNGIILTLITIWSFQVFASGEVLCKIKFENNNNAKLAVIEKVNNETTPMTYRLATISSPEITKKFYAVTGKIKYEDIEGAGYLETWNYFNNGGSYFSKTLNNDGTGTLTGSSEWRNFVVPFSLEGSNSSPNKIEFNLQLPGRGKVRFDNVTLVQSDSMSELFKSSKTWSSNGYIGGATVGIIGGIGGAIIGIIGGVVGVLCALKKAQKHVIVIMLIMTIFGIILFLTGLLALFQSQPYYIYYPLLLLGIITALVFGINIFPVRKRFRQMELKKMESLDK